MYESFFGLTLKPFELVPNPAILYPSRSHRKVLNYLEYGLREKAGFILLTGEIGSGKTTLIRNLVRGLSGDTTLAMIFNTMVTPLQLLAMINEEFGLEPTGKDKVTLLRELNDFLVEQFANQCRPILIIDEAQNLTTEAIEEIRLLSNLELDASKLLQVILVGQPELKEILGQPALRQLRQRISISCHLGALNREDTEGYIFHRLEKAGNRDSVVFQDGTLDVIHQCSGGIPRLINVYCDFVLLAAFVENTRELSLDLVQEVVGDLAEPSSGRHTLQSGQTVDVLEDRVAKVESSLVEITSRLTCNSVTHRRLTNQEKVVRRIDKTQQELIARLDRSLADINSKLEYLLGEISGSKGGPSKQGRTVEPGRVTSRFWFDADAQESS